ncbi:hypothetical protein [Candidatus Ruminimicrobiellum ovillum]|uniref:hypothetical protein n=1 Tax=Candidatus Ruminimicrobiellum ovillum TaxID=1947927 RepID=UPI003559A201
MAKQIKKQPPKTFLLLFILIGLYFCIVGSFPVKIEIKKLQSVTEAQIHRKSMIPPFKNIDLIIPNLKQAVITSSRSSKGQASYRVELEGYNGYLYPVTTYYSSGYNSKLSLQTQINNAIKNGTDFNHTICQTFFLFFGALFVTIPLLMLFVVAKANRVKNNIQETKTTQQIRQSMQNQQTQTISDSENKKYEDINDSIIK